jgi:hypothetical protein
VTQTENAPALSGHEIAFFCRRHIEPRFVVRSVKYPT